jgi:hypothetical protein
MSTIASCPRCSQQVTIPSGAESAEMVRCPLCSQEYPLQEALATAPPVLVVLSSLTAMGRGPLTPRDSGLDLGEPERPAAPRLAEIDELGDLSDDDFSLSEGSLEMPATGDMVHHALPKSADDIELPLETSEGPAGHADEPQSAETEPSDLLNSFDKPEHKMEIAADLPPTTNFGGAASDWLVEEPPLDSALGEEKLDDTAPADEEMFGESAEAEEPGFDTVDLDGEFDEEPTETADGEEYALDAEPAAVGAAPAAAKAGLEPVESTKQRKPSKLTSILMPILMSLIGAGIFLPLIYGVMMFALSMDPLGLAPSLPKMLVPNTLRAKPKPVAFVPPVSTPDTGAPASDDGSGDPAVGQDPSTPGSGTAPDDGSVAGLPGGGSTDDAMSDDSVATDDAATDSAAADSAPADDDSAAGDLAADDADAMGTDSDAAPADSDTADADSGDPLTDDAMSDDAPAAEEDIIVVIPEESADDATADDQPPGDDMLADEEADADAAAADSDAVAGAETDADEMTADDSALADDEPADDMPADDAVADDSSTDSPDSDALADKDDPDADMADSDVPDSDAADSDAPGSDVVASDTADSDAADSDDTADTDAADTVAKDDAPADDAMPEDDKPADDAKPAGTKPGDTKVADDKVKPSKSAVVGPRDGVQYAPADLNRVLAELGAASEALDSSSKSDPATIKKFKGQFYRKLYQLAEVATFTPSMVASAAAEQGSQQDVVYHALSGCAATPSKFAEVGKAAGLWLSAIKGKEHQGIVLTGTIQTISHRGKVFESKVLLSGGEPAVVVTVLSPEAPAVGHQEPVLVWGSIVSDPAQSISGYAGDAPVAVWTTGIDAPPAGAVGTRKAAAAQRR